MRDLKKLADKFYNLTKFSAHPFKEDYPLEYADHENEYGDDPKIPDPNKLNVPYPKGFVHEPGKKEHHYPRKPVKHHIKPKHFIEQIDRKPDDLAPWEIHPSAIESDNEGDWEADFSQFENISEKDYILTDPKQRAKRIEDRRSSRWNYEDDD